MDNPSRFQFHHHKYIPLPKQPVGYYREVACPDVTRLILQEVAQVSRKSIGTMWLDECAFLSFGMYFWMVRLLTSIPSFNNSPRIRSAPHKRFSFAIF